MDRRKFLKTTLMGGALAAVAPTELLALEDQPQGKKPIAMGPGPALMPLKISFQEGTAPGETLAQRLDWMEANGVVGLEPGGKGLAGRVGELKGLLKGRSIQISAICAGFSGFVLSEKKEVRDEFDRSMREIIGAAGELGSTGVIMVPAFNSQVPVMPHTADTRAYLIEQLQSLGDYALKCGTSVILEPLNRTEAFYLRQVADAASICRDANHAGVTCMGDFWHMTFEETSDYAALLSGGTYLRHVHIASRYRRRVPGEGADKDNYVDGFRALRQMNYPYYVSFECDASAGDRNVTIPAALTLMREQWGQAQPHPGPFGDPGGRRIRPEAK